MTTANEEADRLLRLFDLGLAELRKGDAETCVLILKEAAESANRLPKKQPAICLPDRSKEKI